MKQNERRTIGLFFKVSEQERETIDKKRRLASISTLRGYLRKMAVDGYVVNVDMSAIREMVFLLRNVSNNINQLTKRVNETGNFYTADLENIRCEQQKLWEAVNRLLDRFLLEK